MKRFLLLSVWLLSAGFSLSAVPVPPSPNEVDQIFAEGFPASQTRLAAQLRDQYKPGQGNLPSNAGQPAFRNAFLLAQWMELLNRPGIEELGPAFLKEALRNPAFSEDLLFNLTEADSVPQVLQHLQSLWKQNPAQFWQYSRLAIALALVYDQPPPRDWPHHQVTANALPGPAMSIEEALAFWIESDQAKKLYSDPKTLSVGQLKFMVDAFLPAEELRWAQKHARFTRAGFDRAFSSIAYDHGRIRAQQYIWPFANYTLKEIRERGGICVDQAYFAAMAGKANGLPTLFFSGQGSDGGHAWFGFLKGANRWELDCGRYENQNYAVGEARDPQTWQTITDAELSYFAKPSQRSDAFRQSRIDLGLARLYYQNQEPDRALRAATSAVAICPENTEAWKVKAGLLTEPNVRRAHLEKGLNQFPANREMRIYLQKEIAATYREAGDLTKAQEWERKVISENRNDRSDLSITAAAEGLAALVNSNQMEAAMKEYRSLLGRLGRKGGGNLYYEIVAPFTESLIKVGDFKNASRALELARRALEPETNSILDQEMRLLSAKIPEKP